MTDEQPVKSGKAANSTSFKPGYDPRRWLKGRSPKSPEQKEGEKILLAVIWEELSREFDTGSMKPLETPETVDAMRLMVRSWIKKKPELIADRIAGKVQDKLDLSNSDGTLKPEKGLDDERFDRAISSLADAIREGVSGKSPEQNGGVGSAK